MCPDTTLGQYTFFIYSSLIYGPLKEFFQSSLQVALTYCVQNVWSNLMVTAIENAVEIKRCTKIKRMQKNRLQVKHKTWPWTIKIFRA